MSKNNNDEGKSDKPKKPSCCARFSTSMRNAGRFIYNTDTKEILGRSGNSWLKILSFYLVFYSILAGFWAICLVVFLQTLDPIEPTMQKMHSMMKDNPGVNYDPFFSGKTTTLISFDPTNSTTYSKYVDQLKLVYNANINQSMPTGVFKSCNFGDGATVSQACVFDMSTLGDNCSPGNQFGYPDGKPCVLLKINRVFLWDPNNITLDDSCFDVQDKTNPVCSTTLEFKALPNATKTPIDKSHVSISCNGENDGDADNIRSVTFFPPLGFPVQFFPYMNQPNYTSPMVMAQFDVMEGRVSMIMCKIWTQNIVHDMVDLQGSIHFELMVSRQEKNSTSDAQ